MTRSVEADSSPTVRGAEARAELKGISSTRFVEFFIEPGLHHLVDAKPSKIHQGMSLHSIFVGETDEELARQAPPEVYAFRIYKKYSALIQVGNVKKIFTREPEYEPGTVYIDGEVLNIEEAVRRAGKYGPDLRVKRGNEGWKAVVQTRAGTGAGWKTKFKAFDPETDRVVSSKTSTNGSE